jgi:hypothetical protein
MGHTFALFERRGHALEGVSRHGRAASVRGPPARGREDGALVRRVRDFAEDGLQDLRPVQRLRGHGVQRPEPAAASSGESAGGADRGDHHPAETRVSRLGCAEDSREAASAVHRTAPAGDQHGPRGARSPGARPTAAAPAARGHGHHTVAADRAETRSGAPTTRASSCWGIAGTVIP